MIASMTPVTHCVCGHAYEASEIDIANEKAICGECNRAISGMAFWTNNPMKESDEQIAEHVKASHEYSNNPKTFSKEGDTL